MNVTVLVSNNSKHAWRFCPGNLRMLFGSFVADNGAKWGAITKMKSSRISVQQRRVNDLLNRNVGSNRPLPTLKPIGFIFRQFFSIRELAFRSKLRNVNIWKSAEPPRRLKQVSIAVWKSIGGREHSRIGEGKVEKSWAPGDYFYLLYGRHS